MAGPRTPRGGPHAPARTFHEGFHGFDGRLQAAQQKAEHPERLQSVRQLVHVSRVGAKGQLRCAGAGRRQRVGRRVGLCARAAGVQRHEQRARQRRRQPLEQVVLVRADAQAVVVIVVAVVRFAVPAVDRVAGRAAAARGRCGFVGCLGPLCNAPESWVAAAGSVGASRPAGRERIWDAPVPSRAPPTALAAFGTARCFRRAGHQRARADRAASGPSPRRGR